MDMPKMRRKLQVIPDKEALEMLRDGEYGVLAVHGANDYPYAVPINHALLDVGEKLPLIAMHSAVEGHKIKAIRDNPKVSYTVVGQSTVMPEKITDYYKSVIAFGEAWIEEDPELRLRALHALGDKYCPGLDNLVDADIAKSGPHCSIILMRMDELVGKEALELSVERRKGHGIE